jgi:RNA-directed DNA polymerase
MLGIPTFE